MEVHTNALQAEEEETDVNERREYEEKFMTAVKVLIYFADELFPGLEGVKWRLSTLVSCQGMEVLFTL